MNTIFKKDGILFDYIHFNREAQEISPETVTVDDIYFGGEVLMNPQSIVSIVNQYGGNTDNGPDFEKGQYNMSIDLDKINAQKEMTHGKTFNVTFYYELDGVKYSGSRSYYFSDPSMFKGESGSSQNPVEAL